MITMDKPMTENDALTAIMGAAGTAMMDADRLAARLRVLQKRVDAVWLAPTPEKRAEVISAALDYYTDSLAAVGAADRALRKADVVMAVALLASGQCAPGGADQ
jgi:hypothetical protein